jgi:hypothetical protein
MTDPDLATVAAMAALAVGGVEDGGVLATLDGDVRRTASRLADRAARVTLDGKIAFDRANTGR